MTKITKRQKQLLEIIYDYIRDTGYPPTFEEMRESLGVVSNQSIIDLLAKLEKQKLLKRNEASARSLTILPFGDKILERPALIPFLGATTAGSPMEAMEIAGEWKQISPEIKELKNNVFILKVFGDSMINAGIENEDIVLVKEQKEFISGDIVLAQTEDGSTIKRFISDDKPPYIYLKPENPKYKNIPFSENMELKGKIISILKNGYWGPVK
ncbi:MAG: transcriptional repressor LexA [Candidatus Staskawiczbacteria bacterium]|nr:transcriptional repressor LexA [Candidatus Staskawiczbacteria bacterium]